MHSLPFFDMLSRLSTSNLAVVAMLGAIVLLLGLIYVAPNFEASFGRGGKTHEADLRTKLARQFQLLRSPERGMREQASRQLFRDGRSDAPVLVDSDFFLFVRVALSIAMGLVGIILSLLLGSPLFLLTTFLGYIAPSFLANRYNKGRRKKIFAELPIALQRIETRIAAGAEIREAFSKAGGRRTGPLFSELIWASRQMAIPGNNVYEVLHQIDVRNELIPPFFTRLAEQIERGNRRSVSEGRDALLAEIEKVLEDEDSKRQAKIAVLPNKIIMGMSPFLIMGLALALAGPFLAGIINGQSPTM